MAFHFPTTNRQIGLMQVAILRAINLHPESAYGSAIADQISTESGQEVSDAQVYVAIRRLEARDLIREAEMPRGLTSQNTPSKGSRGRPRKYYSLTGSGRRALHHAGSLLNNGPIPDRPNRWKGPDHEETPGLATPSLG